MTEDKASVWKLDLTVQKGLGGMILGDKDQKVEPEPWRSCQRFSCSLLVSHIERSSLCGRVLGMPLASALSDWSSGCGRR